MFYSGAINTLTGDVTGHHTYESLQAWGALSWMRTQFSGAGALECEMKQEPEFL